MDMPTVLTRVCSASESTPSGRGCDSDVMAVYASQSEITGQCVRVSVLAVLSKHRSALEIFDSDLETELGGVFAYGWWSKARD